MHFLVMSLLGALFFIYAIQYVNRGKASLKWDVVEGEVQEVKQVVERGDPTRRQRFDFVDVNYRYRVKGKDYFGDRIRFTVGKRSMNTELERYPVGKVVKVYVDPEQPSMSVLEPGVDISNYIALLAGVFFIAAGIVLAITQS